MKARRTSECPVCIEQINPGDEIVHVEDIGWIHDGCEAILDNPADQDYFHKQFYGDNVLTIRDRVIYNLQYDEADEAIEDALFPGYWADYVY